MVMHAPSSPDDVIPAERPVAPTEEAWARMSAAERARAVRDLLASESLEEIAEREAMAEGDAHLDAKMGIRDTLRHHFGRLGRRIYVGADITVFYPGKKGFTPDVIAVADVEPGRRDSWMVSVERKGVDLAFEVHYQGNRRKDFIANTKRYAALGIREYFAHDMKRRILRAYRLPRPGAGYEPIPLHEGRFHSTVLDLDIALELDHVRFYVGGAVLVSEAETVTNLQRMLDTAMASAQEHAARAEEHAVRAEEHAARADEQAARAQSAALHLASAVITILTVRGVEVGPCARERILGCADVPTLERWVDFATIAATCDELLTT
jgi:Uma2 family endonuclease